MNKKEEVKTGLSKEEEQKGTRIKTRLSIADLIALRRLYESGQRDIDETEYGLICNELYERILEIEWLEELPSEEVKMPTDESEIAVPEYVVKQIANAIRMAANTLNSRERTTAMDRQIEWSERLLKWLLDGKQGKRPMPIPEY